MSSKRFQPPNNSCPKDRSISSLYDKFSYGRCNDPWTSAFFFYGNILELFDGFVSQNLLLCITCRILLTTIDISIDIVRHLNNSMYQRFSHLLRKIIRRLLSSVIAPGLPIRSKPFAVFSSFLVYFFRICMCFSLIPGTHEHIFITLQIYIMISRYLPLLRVTVCTYLLRLSCTVYMRR